MTSVFTPLTILEEELGAIEDYFVLGILFFAGILFFVGGPLVFTQLSVETAAVSSLLVLFTTGCFVPSAVLQRFGLEAPQYIRGAGKTSFFFYEFILDFVAILTIFVRFAVQNIRIVFLLFAYWELYAFVEPHLSWGDILGLSGGSPSNADIFSIVTGGLLYLYYVGHLCILYTIQVTAYLGLSFWLFFFLYTNFSSSRAESYFNLRFVPTRGFLRALFSFKTKSNPQAH